MSEATSGKENESVPNTAAVLNERVADLEYIVNVLREKSAKDLKRLRHADAGVANVGEFEARLSSLELRTDVGDIEKNVRTLELRTEAIEDTSTAVAVQVRAMAAALERDNLRDLSSPKGSRESDPDQNGFLRGFVEQVRAAKIENEQGRQRMKSLADDVQNQLDTRIEAISEEIKRLRLSIHTVKPIHVELAADASDKIDTKPAKASPWDKIPNIFRKVNKTNDGFDPSQAGMEKRFTLMTMTSVLLIVIAMAIYFSHQMYSETEVKRSPSLEDYIKIAARSDLIGVPICECQYPTTSMGGPEGFVDNVSFHMDSSCDLANFAFDSLPLYETSPFTDKHGTRELRKCPYAAIQDLNPSLVGKDPSHADGTDVLGPACAAVTEFLQVATTSI